jgi:hypothetical protein
MSLEKLGDPKGWKKGIAFVWISVIFNETLFLGLWLEINKNHGSAILKIHLLRGWKQG